MPCNILLVEPRPMQENAGFSPPRALNEEIPRVPQCIYRTTTPSAPPRKSGDGDSPLTPPPVIRPIPQADTQFPPIHADAGAHIPRAGIEVTLARSGGAEGRLDALLRGDGDVEVALLEDEEDEGAGEVDDVGGEGPGGGRGFDGGVLGIAIVVAAGGGRSGRRGSCGLGRRGYRR